MILVDVWKTTPFMTLVDPGRLADAAHRLLRGGAVDGVHPLKVFFKVTLPWIKPALMVAVIFSPAGRCASST